MRTFCGHGRHSCALGAPVGSAYGRPIGRPSQVRSLLTLLDMSAAQPRSPSSKGRRTGPDSRLREALLEVPRSLFSTEAPERRSGLREPAEDPTLVTMLEALELTGTERVLEIGSPTAYTAAVLSHLAAEVYSVAAEPELAQRRRRELHASGCRNVHVVPSAPHAGWPEGAPYQAILVSGAASQVPLELVHQLDLGGRLVIPIGDENAQLLERMHLRQGAVSSETVGSCQLAMLADASHSPSLVPWASEPEE
jgi:protein-L-isoaspartate(D-aspartate) O-methyltransferase